MSILLHTMRNKFVPRLTAGRIVVYSRPVKLLLLLTVLILLIQIYLYRSDSSKSVQNGPCSLLGLDTFQDNHCSFFNSPVVAVVTTYSGGRIAGCSGALVSTMDILTAAHCLTGGEIISVDVLLNEAVYHVDRGKGSIHPKYDGKIGTPYDIAMISLIESPKIRPIPLLISDYLNTGEQITFFGFGSDKKEEEFFDIGLRSLHADTMIINGMIPGLFSGLFNDSGSAVCEGDSGGPVIQQSNGVVGIVGVSSFNVRGCLDNSMSGFIDIQYPEIFNFIVEYSKEVILL